MRKVALGAAPKRGNWSPKFKARAKRRKEKLDVAEDAERPETGKKKTQIVSYHPPARGESRMERLRHYFHREMALLLDAWPDVEEWTTETEAVEVPTGDGTFSFTPDFL